jgi:hypothetical protein
MDGRRRARDLDATTAKAGYGWKSSSSWVMESLFPRDPLLPRALVSPVTDRTANGALYVPTSIRSMLLFV